MTISSELTKLNTNMQNAYTAVNGKGGTLPQAQNMDNLATAISSIPSGGGSSEVVEVTFKSNIGNIQPFIYQSSFSLRAFLTSSGSSCLCYKNQPVTVNHNLGNWTYSINGTSMQATDTISVSFTPTTDTEFILLSWSSTCVSGDTQITMSDNSIKEIKDVVVGDKVLGYNETTGQSIIVDVLNIHQHQTDKIYTITTNNSTIKVTQEHLLLTNKGWSAINVENSQLAYSQVNNIASLTIGDKLIDKDNNECEIINIQEAQGNFDVYTLDVTDGVDTFITNSFISHNKAG